MREHALQRRHEFVLLFDVADGNPNGDPDAGNMPRMDPETGHGLVSDVCLKRKIRNYVEMAKADAPRFRIYVTEGAVLNEKHREAYLRERPGDAKTLKAKELSPDNEDEAWRLRDFMCDNFFDIRAFGAVMGTKINSGQVRGPVQIGFARSIEPVLPMEVTITRMAATSEKEKKDRVEGEDDREKRGDNRTMGRKHLIPYGLYRAHGYVSAPLAHDGRKGTGFSDDDLDLLLIAMRDMFDHDRSAARGEMATRGLILFRHASALGNARAHELFDRVRVRRVIDGHGVAPDSAAARAAPPARGFADYAIEEDRDGLPQGVEMLRLC